jgi:hypothetical protein
MTADQLAKHLANAHFAFIEVSADVLAIRWLRRASLNAAPGRAKRVSE